MAEQAIRSAGNKVRAKPLPTAKARPKGWITAILFLIVVGIGLGSYFVLAGIGEPALSSAANGAYAVIRVPAGGNFQAALDRAKPGDTIELAAGATYKGKFTLPNKAGAEFITVRTSADDSRLPAAGKRLEYKKYADILPKIVSNVKGEPALTTAAGAHHFRFVGIEFGPTIEGLYNIIEIGTTEETSIEQLPHHIEFDRVAVLGDPKWGQRRGIAANGKFIKIENSYFADIKREGEESQAIAVWASDGPIEIVNNYLEAAAENILFGGAENALGLVAADCVIRDNHLNKPIEWKGTKWNVKNFIEIKSGRRIKIENNLSKDQILELYINQIFLGQRAYGFAAAAQIYYGKPLKDITLAEAAMLAGLPKAPSAYNPIANPKRAKIRQQYVLRRMRDLGNINEAQYEAALKETLVVKRELAEYAVHAEYAAEMARQIATERFPEDVYSRGLKVYTTLIKAEQEAAYVSLRRGVMDYDRRHGYRGAESYLDMKEIKTDQDEAIDEALQDIADAGDLIPALVLAADAKQKISLGRGLVREDVSAVLFDEPLTVIDPHLKWQLRRKLKQIHHELKLTLVYVTHDQVEALTFADQVVVMTRGRAVQVGTASELFERPRHTFVGHFIGSPGMNFLPADVLPGAPAGAAKLGVRPEYVTLAAPQAAGAVKATVTQRQDIGTWWLLGATLADGSVVRARLGGEQAIPQLGETAWLTLAGSHTCWYGANEELVA